MLTPAPLQNRKAPASASSAVRVQRKSDSPAARMGEGVASGGHDFSRVSVALQPKLALNQPGDKFEQEADRAADAVSAGRSVSVNEVATANALQRDEPQTGPPPPGKEQTDEEKYKAAAKKIGEAFLKTDTGKELKAKAEELGKDFVSTVEGKVITGAALGGALSAIIATNSELPVPIPELPLDFIAPGLKADITWEGPVQNPTKVALKLTTKGGVSVGASFTSKPAAGKKPAEQTAGLTFSIPLGGSPAKKKGGPSESERYRAETARMAAEQAKFREGLKSPRQRATEQEEFWDAHWRMQMNDPLNPLRLRGLPPPSPAKPEERKKEEEPVQRKAAHTSAPAKAASSAVREVLSDPGQPLDAQTRISMETKFGHDFGRVRIHTDARADESARAVHANAYTVGQHIVFGAGRYSPHSPDGGKLLAHELTHVVQQTQAGPGGASLQRQKKPKPITKPVKFYEEVADAIQVQEQRMAEQARQSPILVIEHLNYKGLKALLPLCEAVEQERTADVPKLLDAFIEADTGFLLGTISAPVMIELAARMIKLGLEAESRKLREHFEEQARPHDWLKMGAARREVGFLERLVELAVTSSDATTPEKTAASLDFLIRAFLPLRDAVGAVDLEALEWERLTQGGWRVLRPGMSHQEYYNALLTLVERLFTGIETMLQALIESATSELEAGTGTSTLEMARKILESKLHPALFPRDPKKNIAGARLKITRTQLKKGRGRIEDAFLTGEAARKRSVAITSYDPEQEYVRELEMTLERLYQVRVDQVLALARIYGAVDVLPREKPFSGAGITDDAERNAEAIKKLKGGRLRLHSDDDWREFVLQKYKDLVEPTGRRLRRRPGEALRAVIDLLFAYLRAFTVHARFTNVYDIGDSYLNRNFPRTLSGQLIHDCGVYALRVAYILSLVRNQLGLRFRFVELPAHLALVIDGDKLPAFIVHNDHFEEYSAEDWANARARWEAFSEKQPAPGEGGPGSIAQEKAPAAGKTPPGPKDETQFVGEIAGGTFIPGPVDMPFQVTEVPVVGEDAKAAQRKYWDYYQRSATAELFGPASKKKGESGYLFHTRYLAFTEDLRRLHNQVFMKFWNEDGPAAWEAFEKQLSTPRTRTAINAGELQPLLEAYREAYLKSLKPVDDRMASFYSEERRISAQIRDDPKLRAKKARLSYGPRAATMWHFHWDIHRNDLKQFVQRVTVQPEETHGIAEVRSKLTPKWVPRGEKRMDPLD